MDIQKIRAYLKGLDAGTLQPEEEAWIIGFLENATKEELAAVFPEQEWASLEEAPVDRQKLDHVYKNIAADIRPAAAQVIQMKAWWRRSWVKAAGAAAILVAGAVSFQLGRPGRQQHREAEMLAWKTVSTAAGQRIVIHLQDSTDVYVNGGSTVMYPERFAKGSREIKLVEGEAFLDVAQDPQRPFKVTTGDIHVDVLGTSFNIRNYSDETEVDIAVKTGRVAVNGKGKENVLLSSGKKVVFSKVSEGSMVLTEIKPAAIDGWINNDLVFADVKLEDVFRNLRYNYGIDFKVQNSKILDKHIRGAFHRKSKEEIIYLLSKMARFNYRIKDSLVIIN